MQAATLTLGGRDGVTGQGGAVTVNTDVSAILTTAGDYAIGILAQSVGGGGLAQALPTTAAANDPAASGTALQAFRFANDSPGDGGAVVWRRAATPISRGPRAASSPPGATPMAS